MTNNLTDNQDWLKTAAGIERSDASQPDHVMRH